jgi:predicted membrane protein
MKEKLYRFMQGRYGMDQLNQFIFYVELIFFIISLFNRSILITGAFYICLVLVMYRMLSRNYVKRSIENQKFIHIKSKVTHRFQSIYKNVKDKNNKYLVCPKCAQIIRIPRHKGNITVTCPSCRQSFDAKS